MNSLLRSSIVSFIILFSWIDMAEAHDLADPRGKEETQLIDLIHQQYGADFNQVRFSILDEIISDSKLQMTSRLQDLYKTLRGCILSTTYIDDGRNESYAFIVA